MDKKKRNANGTVHIEDVKLEGGITIPIILHKEDGIFRARFSKIHEGETITHHEGKDWEGKDLDKIRTQVREWHKEQIKLKWEPIIVLHPDYDHSSGSNSRNVLGSSFERVMRAKKIKGDGYEWKSWGYNKPNNGGFIYIDDLEVYEPGGSDSEPHAWNNNPEPIVIEYTPARWLALLKLCEMEEALRSRLGEIFQTDQKKLDFFFRQITGTGLLAFSGLKIKEKPDV